MKLSITIEISPETAAKAQITFESLCAFAEDLRQDAIREVPSAIVTFEATP